MKRFFGLIVLCTLLVAVLCGTVTVASAEQNDVELNLDVTEQGEEIVAVVTLTRNDGVMDLYLRVEYDENALELTDRTFGSALSALSPQDNFEVNAYEPPYRVTYLDNVDNVTDTGRLFTLRFKIKSGARNGSHAIKLVVRQVGYFVGDSREPVYNEKYGAPLEITADAESTKTGGVVVAEKTVSTLSGDVSSIREGKATEEVKATKKLVIGLIAGGAAVIVIVMIVAYIVYRKKTANADNTGK